MIDEEKLYKTDNEKISENVIFLWLSTQETTQKILIDSHFDEKPNCRLFRRFQSILILILVHKNQIKIS